MGYCGYCQVHFRTHWGMRQHQVTCHPETVTHRCRVCTTPFASRTDLDRYIAMEGHYASAATTPPPRIPSTIHRISPVGPESTCTPKLKSVITIPRKDAPNPTGSQPKGKTDRRSTSRVSKEKPYRERSKGKMSNFTIPKKSSVVPEDKPYSGRRSAPSTSTATSSTEPQPTGHTDGRATAPPPPTQMDTRPAACLLDDPEWLNSIFKQN